jgi:hypothetical protein
MKERDPHFALAIDEIEKGIEESLKKILENKEEKPDKKIA